MAESALLSDRRARLATARLYAILDLGYVAASRVETVAAQLISGGVDLLQLRAKGVPPSKLIELGCALRRQVHPAGPLLILNDHPELAAEIGADGVHLGQDDAPLALARVQAGAAAARELIFGKSTHSLEQAIAAEREGADYIGVGPIFATPTKPSYSAVGPALIARVRAAVRLPQFCIGGINERTLDLVLAAGAERVVIVSALLQSADIPAYCRQVRARLNRSTNVVVSPLKESSS